MTDPAKTPDSVPGGDDVPQENEVLREARMVKDMRDRAKSSISWKTAAAAGLGSAALIAALLYANRKD